MYRNAINMCVVWYRVEKKTGKMQDVYAKYAGVREKCPKTPSLERYNNREDA
jgi:hypothetical protein